ncbi:MAG: hypothetical protein NDJ65_01020 [Paludibacteraceae bacterium]|nr:hypothetical protein [Paludibacteraceae bacterium]
MKKLLFCLLAACTVISCSDDKDDDSYLSNVPDGMLGFIQIRFDASLINTPSDSREDALLFLFPTEGKFIKEDPTPHSFTSTYGDEICAIDDVNNESIFCNYSGSFLQEKDPSNGKYTMSYVDAAFTPNVLTLASYFSKGEYLIVIYVNGTYFCHYETIDPKEKYAELHYNLVQTENSSGYAERYIWF